MTIAVTADDIATGKRGAMYACALVLAIERATGRPAAVGVTLCYVGTIAYPLPEAAVEFRERFDQRREVEPMSFEMEVA